MPSEQMNQYLLQLKNLLVEYFDTEEFEELCFALGLNHEDFIAQKVSARFQKLIVHLHKLHRLDALLALCREYRPNVAWPDPPAVASKRPPSPRPVEPALTPPSWLNQLLTRLRQISPRTLGVIGLLLVLLLLWQAIGRFGGGRATPTAVAQATTPSTATPTATHPAIAQATTPPTATRSVSPQPTAVESATTPPTATPTAKPPTLAPSNTPPPTAPPTSTTTPTITPTPAPTLGDQRTRPTDGMVMVYVPAGTFNMGSDPAQDPNAQSDEQPPHEVTLTAFWLDRTEVTNALYAQCVSAGQCAASDYANDADWNGANLPVVGVSWQDATDYCQWAGGQLPTEAQWEYAARGTDGRLYPWGNESPTCALAQFDDCDGNTVAVGSFSPAGDSWVGAADMAGNVWEWVADWYNEDTYENSPSNNPSGPESGQYKVLRGGSWHGNTVYLRSANRFDVAPDNRYNNVGFRCVLP